MKNRKKILCVSLMLILMFSLTSCSRKALSEPLPGDEAAAVFYNEALSAQQQLLKNGTPISVPGTSPSILAFQSTLQVNGASVESYNRTEQGEALISISSPYTDLEGVITFRGDNYRSGANFGIANIVEKKFDKKSTWDINTGKLKKTTGKGYWTGSGWTGQPIIIRWSNEERRNMNLYEDKKNKEGLVEIIYATMDGNIYFLDLEDGSATRDKIALGFPVKGTGSLYPDGTPLYFVGAGDSMGDKCARTFIIDLIQGKIIYEYGFDDDFSTREDNNRFHAYDSSPLIDVDTDTVIQPGENGILYTTKLNTVYDGKSVAINPDKSVKWRYTTNRSGEEKYWLGMESSAVIWNNYLYIADNCADLFCIDLNTMELIWVQDIADDSNASPVFEESIEDGTAYIYISTSLHWTKNSKDSGEIPVFKINAATGEIIWQRNYPCQTVNGVSGGVQATALLGKEKLSGLVYFSVARTGGKDQGKLIALSKETGGEVWSVDMGYYGWSSPIALYDAEGNGYVILCDSDGNMFLLDGLTGVLYDTINLGDNIEASPAAFNNQIVVGTRGKKIYGITVK